MDIVRLVTARLAVALLAASCADPATGSFPTPVPSPTRVGTLTLAEDGCTFEQSVPQIRPGAIAVAVFNRLLIKGEAYLSRIEDGRSYEELADHTRRDREAAEAGRVRLDPWPHLSRPIPLELGPGGSATMTSYPAAGTWAIVCLRFYDNLREVRPYDLVGPIKIS